LWSDQIRDEIFGQLKQSMRRKSLVFVQMNPLISNVLDRARNDTGFTFTNCSGSGLPTHFESKFIILENFQHIFTDSHDPAVALGRAREDINALLDDGTCICIVSSVPRLAYPNCIGSAVVEDASSFHPDRALHRAHEASGTTDVIPSCWPSRVEPADMRSTLLELGLDSLAALDFLLFELRISNDIPHDLVTDREWDALRGAGLYSVDKLNPDLLHLNVPASVLTPCVAEVISESLGVQSGYGAVTEALVELERRIRRALRNRAVSLYGSKWRGQAVGSDLATRAVSRAASDSAFNQDSIKSLRDPFEWLTLSELLDIIVGSACPEHLGASVDFWRRFGHEVLPVRNRLSHMRLLRFDDARTIQYWRVAVQQKLP
jgi:hypothetical protein